ncbi:MAG: DUF4915 domain-containing protein, partial [Bacillota bacterium]
EKTMRKIKKTPICILDNSKVMQNTSFNGVEVVPVEEVNEIDDEFIVLITTGSYKSVIKQLTNLGYKEAVDFYCSPVLYNNKIENDIKTNEQTLLFTCSEIPDEDSNNKGGGLYTFNTKTSKLEKHFSAKLHEIVKTDEKYYIIDEFEGVRVFNKQLQLVDTYEGLAGSIMHGLAYDPENEILFIANTGRDSVSLMEANTGELIEEISIAKKKKTEDVDQHHLNDLFYYKGYLYISMFSFSGLWREGCYDGGVAQLDLSTKEIVGYPINDLWMPHSIQFINGEIVIIDSMRGDVYKTNNKKLVNMPGFVRGITTDGKYYYIGQSEPRYFDRLKGVTKNISLNCGIHLYDNVTKVSRFYSFENMTNIHTIVIKD